MGFKCSFPGSNTFLDSYSKQINKLPNFVLYVGHLSILKYYLDEVRGLFLFTIKFSGPSTMPDTKKVLSECLLNEWIDN